jgi:hypothetical protein
MSTETTKHRLVLMLRQTKQAEALYAEELKRAGVPHAHAHERAEAAYAGEVDRLVRRIANDMSVLPQYAPRIKL